MKEILDAIKNTSNLVDAAALVGCSKTTLLKKLQSAFPDKPRNISWNAYLKISALPDSKARPRNATFWFGYYYFEDRYVTGTGVPGADCKVYFSKELPDLLAHSLEYFVWSYFPRREDRSLVVGGPEPVLEIINKFINFIEDHNGLSKHTRT